MFEKGDLSNEELLDAIKRSGYLLESEISHMLSEAGFFVETNQPLLDPLTGKSRELDLQAEYFDNNNPNFGNKVCSKINFVFEIKNNIYPLVLMTKHEFSPNIEMWDALKQSITIPDEVKGGNVPSYYESLIESNDANIFTQYCSFSEKKDKSKELMACHPEALHSGFSKIVQHCDDMVGTWGEGMADEYFRVFLWLPILLINDGLYELDIESNDQPTLNKVEWSKLIFNYHRGEIQKNAIIYVVTKHSLKKFLIEMLETGKTIETQMIKAKSLAAG